MEIKHTLQGLLIYSTIAAYLLAFAATVAGRKKGGQTLFFAGFCAALLSYAYRWVHVGHVPLQNLFEVFLALGVLCYPISWFCRRALRIGGQWSDMLIGAIVLVPAGFTFDAQPQHLPPALQSWLFAPHVGVYVLSYIFMAKAFFQAVEQLLVKPKGEHAFLPPERATYELITIGFPLLTLGLLLGSVWGSDAWGRFWGWDPKELWSLASWLVYVLYLHWHYMYGTRHSKINSVLAILGLIVIVITLLWVNFSRLFPGMHSYAM